MLFFFVIDTPFCVLSFLAQFFVGLIGLVSLVIVICLVSVVGPVCLVDLVCLVNCSLKRQNSNQKSKQMHLNITKVLLPTTVFDFNNFINFLKSNFLFRAKL